ESGERGFIITGKEEFLQPYHIAVAHLDDRLAILKKKTLDDPSQQERINNLDKAIGARMALLEKGVELRRQGERQAQEFLIAKKGKEEMDRVRDLVALIEQQEQASLQDREVQSSRSYYVAVGTGLATAL